ncbi:hypothetical protein EV122DRAFT_291943 [Schizophyllum commune]
MSMQHITKSAIRGVKNVAKGYSDTQTKVRDATSNDPWGPSGMQMNEIAQLSYNQGDFLDIVEILYKRLNDKGKNWRHVFKSLTVLDYLLRQGSQNVVMYFRDNIYIIKTLREFQYVDEEGKDQGANVRQKAKEITNLLTDEGSLRVARQARADMRDRMLANSHKNENRGRRDLNKEDDELRRAIEESKRSFATEKEERELQEALRLSKEEEEARAKAVSESNARSLFDDTEDASTSNNNNNDLIAMADPTPYMAGLQPQFTAAPPQFLQPQYTAMPLQPQYTSFNPFQQQMDMQQQMLLQQQQQQQQEEWLRQQLLQQQQQQQQEEWLRQQQMLQQQQMQSPQFLTAQPTGLGTNNPFARTSPSPSGSSSPLPSIHTSSGPSFNLTGTYDNHSNPPSFGSSASSLSPVSPASTRSTSPQQPQSQGFKVKTKDTENERLAFLLANRDDGQDTFGNTGLLRYAQGAGLQIIAKQHSSHNPFAKPQQQGQPQQQQQSSDQPFFSI